MNQHQPTARSVEANGVPLAVETFGAPTDPAILLVHGACASMLWWEDELCARIAGNGRFVIRYDHRDTGASVSYPPGRPGYRMSDLAADAIGILDALAIERAHLVGRSMGGGVVAIAAVDHPDRVASLTLVGATTGADDLPPMSAEVLGYPAARPDLADPAAVVAFVVGLMRVYAGGSRHFDEPATRALAERDVARTAQPASTLTNHLVMEVDGAARGGLGDLTAPTLVVHGELDPVFPLPHGEALRAAIPGARLLVLPGTGHELPRPQWDLFLAELTEHTVTR